jgi:hypothetical protein
MLQAKRKEEASKRRPKNKPSAVAGMPLGPSEEGEANRSEKG